MSGPDAVPLDVFWPRLVSMADEAAATFVRTSFSTLVRDSNDYAVVLTDPQGRSLAQSSHSIPSFNTCLPTTVRHALSTFPAQTLAPGDMIITNDPWQGTGHIHDMSTVMPLFRGEELIGFGTVASHLPDIGGVLRNPGAREIFEEGLQLPFVKIMDAGRPNPMLVDLIRRNVRVPDATMGDIWGHASACRMLEQRLNGLVDEYGDLAHASAEIRARSRAAMEAAIAALPEGEFEATIEPDTPFGQIVIRCKLIIADRKIHADFSGSSGQLARAINVVPIYVYAMTAYAIKLMLSPDVPNNDGAHEPISSHAPEGTILNPRYPAACGARHMVGHLIPGVVMQALSKAKPETARAEGSTMFSLTMVGTHRGRRYTALNFMNSGQGATPLRPGADVLSFPSNLANTPVEVIEAGAPIRVLRREMRTESGGPGKHRGGRGQVFEFELVGDSDATCSFMTTRLEKSAQGLAGGGNGAAGRVLINGRPADVGQTCVIRPGDVVCVETPGGGGYGTPDH